MPVYKQGVEDAVKRTLFTTIGDIIAASAVDTPARIAAPASGQVLTGQGAGVLPAWSAAAGGGAVAREGGNTTEATTTSITAVDLLTAASLTIAVAEPFMATASVRKTGGAATAARAGVKLNATEVRVDASWSSTVDSIQQGVWRYDCAARAASHLRGGIMTIGGSDLAPTLYEQATADDPNVQITSVIMTGRVLNASVTMGADEMHVYSFAAS